MRKEREVGQKKSNDLARAKKLAAIILEQIDGVLCVKLKQLKPEVEELRGHFKKLKAKDRIEGCRTWEQFCSDKLGRTASAVRKMLAVPKSEAGKSPADFIDAESSYDAEAAYEPGNTNEEEEESREAERKQNGKQKSNACKALREFLGNIPDEGTLTNLLQEMFPDHLITVTISSLPFAIEQDAWAEQEVTQ
jgi:hypothetical protein